MKIGAPIHINVKVNNMNGVFRKIVNAAEQCHLNIPETEQGRNKKHYRQLVNRSLILHQVMPIHTSLKVELWAGHANCVIG